MRYHIDIRVGRDRLSYFTSRTYLTVVDLPGSGEHICHVAVQVSKVGLCVCVWGGGGGGGG